MGFVFCFQYNSLPQSLNPWITAPVSCTIWAAQCGTALTNCLHASDQLRLQRSLTVTLRSVNASADWAQLLISTQSSGSIPDGHTCKMCCTSAAKAQRIFFYNIPYNIQEQSDAHQRENKQDTYLLAQARDQSGPRLYTLRRHQQYQLWPSVCICNTKLNGVTMQGCR